jgi:hypothetical protein
MASVVVVEEEQIQNDIENSDDDEIDETGKTDDQSAVKTKKKRKKKKKNKGRINHCKKNQYDFILAQIVTNDDNTEIDPVPNGTEAIAALSVQQDGIDI